MSRSWSSGVRPQKVSPGEETASTSLHKRKENGQISWLVGSPGGGQSTGQEQGSGEVQGASPHTPLWSCFDPVSVQQTCSQFFLETLGDYTTSTTTIHATPFCLPVSLSSLSLSHTHTHTHTHGFGAALREHYPHLLSEVVLSCFPQEFKSGGPSNPLSRLSLPSAMKKVPGCA